MSRNRDISINELARVVETDADSHWYEERGYPALREFDATCADGSFCHVITGGPLINSAAFCSRHDNATCEGCVRVMCVLTSERLNKLKMALLGYELEGVESDPPGLALVEAEL